VPWTGPFRLTRHLTLSYARLNHRFGRMYLPRNRNTPKSSVPDRNSVWSAEHCSACCRPRTGNSVRITPSISFNSRKAMLCAPNKRISTMAPKRAHFRANVSEAASDFARETRSCLSRISSIGISESQLWTKVLGTEPNFVQKLGTEPDFAIQHKPSGPL